MATPNPLDRRPGRLSQEWRKFAEHVLPADAPPIQKSESKRCFYAGAATMFGLITRGLTPDAEPTDEDVDRLEALYQELEAFKRDLLEGRA
jgi:hypothetical protein